MAIAHALTDTSADIASAGATMVLTKPTGAGASHILIAVISFDRGGTTAPTATPPAGWTAINTNFVTGPGPSVRLHAFWALGNVASTTFTNSATTDQQGWTCSAFTGCDLTTPIDATGTTNSSTGANSLTTNLVTIATDQAWHCIALADWLGGQFSNASFTLKENGNPPANASAALLYNTTPKSVGSTGTVIVADSASATAQIINAMPFALRPAAAAAASFPYPDAMRSHQALLAA